MAESGVELSWLAPHLSVFANAYPYLTQFWLSISVAYDIILGAVPFLFLVVLWPRVQRRATRVIRIDKPPRQDFEAISSSDFLSIYANKVAKALKMKPRQGPYERPAHLHTWLIFNWLQLMVWGIIVGVFGELALSIGWRSPLSWDGLWYDLLYARANGQPNGAHIISYIGIPLFALVVSYKFATQKGITKLAGDSFQGASAAGFLGGVHELIWMVFRYTAYGAGSLLSEQIRDASFAIMCVLLIGAFWKFPKRMIPMRVFLWPTAAYVIFCCAWFAIPTLFGYPLLPITTINNPAIANNLYQETPWFNVPWVNAAEVVSWTMLYSLFIVQVLRYHGRRA